MIDFFFLVPIAIGMGLAGLASFMWTLKSGQYDDLEGAAQRILFEGNQGPVLEEKHPTPSTGIKSEAGGRGEKLRSDVPGSMRDSAMR